MNTITLTLTSEPGLGKGPLLRAIAALLTLNGIKVSNLPTSEEYLKGVYKFEISPDFIKFSTIESYYSGINPAS